MKTLITFICLVMLSACTERKQTDGVTGGPSGIAGTASLEINPKDATRNSVLTLSSTVFDLRTARLEWMVNGAPLPEEDGYQLQTDILEKGDIVQARAYVDEVEIVSEEITIMNSPPEIKKAELVEKGKGLELEVEGQDADGDPVEFIYEWKNNDEPAGKESRIEAKLKKGDRIIVSVTPFDGVDYGKPLVARREIANVNPVIKPSNAFSFKDSLYTYQVKAEDPDGDTLTYSLESPADGMTIDQSTGLFEWKVPAEFKGSTKVSVVVTDGSGGSATYPLSISIK